MRFGNTKLKQYKGPKLFIKKGYIQKSIRKNFKQIKSFTKGYTK